MFRKFHNLCERTMFTEPKTAQQNVGIFGIWTTPNSFFPFEAAIKLKKSISSFGVVKYMVAYANSHAFSYVPQVVREQGEEENLFTQLENEGIIRPAEPYVCGVCGRRFYNNDKIVNHFMQIHEHEQNTR